MNTIQSKLIDKKITKNVFENKILLFESSRSIVLDALMRSKNAGVKIGKNFKNYINGIKIAKIDGKRIFTDAEADELIELSEKNSLTPDEEEILENYFKRITDVQKTYIIRNIIKDRFENDTGAIAFYSKIRNGALNRKNLQKKFGKSIEKITREDIELYFDEILNNHLDNSKANMGPEYRTQYDLEMTEMLENDKYVDDMLTKYRQRVNLKYPATFAQKLFNFLEGKGAFAEFSARLYSAIENGLGGFSQQKARAKLQKVNQQFIEEFKAKFDKISDDPEIFQDVAEEYSSRYKRAVYLAMTSEAGSQKVWKNVRKELNSMLTGLGAKEEEKLALNNLLDGIYKSNGNNGKTSLDEFFTLIDEEAKKPGVIKMVKNSFKAGWAARWKQSFSKFFKEFKSIKKQEGEVFLKFITRYAIERISQVFEFLYNKAGGAAGLRSWSVYGNTTTLLKLMRGVMAGSRVKGNVPSGLLKTFAKIMGTFIRLHFVNFFVSSITILINGIIDIILEPIGVERGNKETIAKQILENAQKRFTLKYWADWQNLIPFDIGPVPYLVYRIGDAIFNKDTKEQQESLLAKALKKEMELAGFTDEDGEWKVLDDLNKMEKYRDSWKSKAEETNDENEKIKYEAKYNELDNKIKKEYKKYTKKSLDYAKWNTELGKILIPAKIDNKTDKKFLGAAYRLKYPGSDVNRTVENNLKVDIPKYILDNKRKEVLKQLWNQDVEYSDLVSGIKEWAINNTKSYYEFKDGTKWKFISADSNPGNLSATFTDPKGNEKNIEDFHKKLESTGTLKESHLKNKLKNIISEMNEGKKFGEDNFKHWKDTFKFKKYDEKTNQLKDVKITSKMDEIMDRIDHFRKKYDEDDSFVRAVIDVYGTGIDIIQYTKGLAHLSEGVIVEGLMSVLANLREAKELVTWTVKHYKDGNWELVKGNFNKQELLNVGKTKRERDERQKESDNPTESLKKKEQEAIMILKRDEKEGLKGLPTKVKEKIKEKLKQGWTTETPFDFLSDFYTVSEINSVFNDKIKVYKLRSNLDFFKSLSKNSSKINIKKGFCKSIRRADMATGMEEKEKNTYHNFVTKCKTKFGV